MASDSCVEAGTLEMLLHAFRTCLPCTETPNVGVEGPKLVSDPKKFPGIANGCLNFEPISDYFPQAQKFLDLALIVGVYDFWHKTVEGPLVPCTLAEDGCPAQACLSRFQDEKFEEQSVFMKGHTPFRVMVFLFQKASLRPATTNPH